MTERALALDFTIDGLAFQLVKASPDLPPVPNHNYYQHRHPVLELHYVTRGWHCVASANTVHRVEAGQLLIIPAGTYHDTCRVSPDCSRVSIALEMGQVPGGRAELARQLRAGLTLPAPLVVELAAHGELAGVLARMRTLTRENTALEREKLRALCALLVMELFDILSRSRTPRRQATPASVAPEFIIDEFFGSHFHMSNGAPVLAQRLHVSLRQLNRIMKACCGMNYRQKLAETRLEIARDLLARGDKSISQIAQLLGYSSVAAFGAFIKQATGKTPSQLRTQGYRPAGGGEKKG